jgi:polyhydroxybutyrate depolymerase
MVAINASTLDKAPEALRLICSALVGLLVTACPQALAQTQWEWVPGSRQARPVSAARQAQIYQPQPDQQGQTTQYVQRGRWGQPAIIQIRQPYSGQSSSQSSGQDPVQNSVQNPKIPQAQTQQASGTRSYHYADTVVVDGQNRQFQVHIPACYERTKATPLVLAFHGLHMNSTMMMGISGFNGASERNGFIVVYGDSVGGRWSDGTNQAATAADVAYVEAIIERLGKVANIDRRRIYACGISNGGYFTQALACAIPDKIAAAGSVAAPLMEQAARTMQSGKPVPIAFILGSDDPLIPWGDGRVKDIGKLGEALGLSSLGSIDSSMVRMGGLMTVPETIAFWTNHNHSSTTPTTSQLPDRDPKDGTRIKREQYGSGPNEVLLYTVEGGGHTWPGCINLQAISGISGNISQDASGSELLWEFFRNHSL